MISIKITGDEALVAKLTAMPGRVRSELIKKVTSLTLLLEARVKGKLSGTVLNVRSGALRRSIFSKVVKEEQLVQGNVASSGDVKYAAIHEFGGKTAAHEIVATKAKALAFMMGGEMIFRKSVHHPGSVIPERSYMRSSLKEMRTEIVKGLKDAVRSGLQ